jgi:hypothetical protein
MESIQDTGRRVSLATEVVVSLFANLAKRTTLARNVSVIEFEGKIRSASPYVPQLGSDLQSYAISANFP